MTLALSVIGRNTVWMLADRRLSFVKGRRKWFEDDGKKMMFIKGADGNAILSYAGLGHTGKTQPSDWMSSVLRGGGGTIEQALGAIGKGMSEEFPRHVMNLTDHSVVVSAIVDGETRIYTIDLERSPKKKSAVVYLRRPFEENCEPRRFPRILAKGTGSAYLDDSDRKNLYGLMKACDKGKITELEVADYLASINFHVYSILRQDNIKSRYRDSVGPRSIVAWRNRCGGGGQQFYTEEERDTYSVKLPTIANGMDVMALSNATMPLTVQRLRGSISEEEFAKEVKEELAKLPEGPDKKLR